MITATSVTSHPSYIFTSCRRSHRKPDCSRHVRPCFECALMVFKREASSKSVSLVCKARAKDGHGGPLKLVRHTDYGEHRIQHLANQAKCASAS